MSEASDIFSGTQAGPVAHDDAPAHTAADRWLRTTLGQITLHGPHQTREGAMLRAFRYGWLTRDRELRQPLEAASAAEGEIKP
jgi:hypothetical protein